MSEPLIVCDCHTHAVRVSRQDDGTVYVATWRLFYKGSDYRGGWRQRLRLAWKVLRTGEPWDDELVLTQTNAWDMARALVGAPDHATFTWQTVWTSNAWAGSREENQQ